MSSPLKLAMLAAARRMLEPFARLMLEAGIGVGEIHALTDRAFVKAARAQTPDGSRPNISRIASVTGLKRSDVTEILSTADDDPPEPVRGRSRAERVLAGWWTDPDFLGGDGLPEPLPLRGPRRSFAALVKRYSGDPRVNTLRDELLRVRAIRRMPDGRYEAISRTYATVRWEPGGVRTVGEQVRDHLETLLHNLSNPARPRYARFVVNAQLDPKYAPILIRDLTEQADVMADSMEDALNDPTATLTPGRKTQPGRRLGIGIYIVDEASAIEPRGSGRAQEREDRLGRERRRG